MKKLEKNKNVVSDKALIHNIAYELNVVEVAVAENAFLVEETKKLKERILALTPSADKATIKADEKLAKRVEKLKKKAKKEAKRAKFKKTKRLLKIMEIEVVERGGINIQISDSKAEDFEIVDGVLIKYLGSGGLVVVPSTVVSVAEKAFYSNDKINEIIFHYGIKNIGESSFYYCNNLKEVILPDGITSIGDSAFYNCRALKTVQLGEGLNSVGRYAFGKCSALEALAIPKDLATLGDKAFAECKNLTRKTKRRIRKINKQALK